MKSAKSILLRIQHAQQEHDQKVHRDILNLDTQTRLKHMTLHFLKYAGKIAYARDNGDEHALGSILIDTLIICLATANTLNVNLGTGMNFDGDDLQSLSVRLAEGIPKDKIFDHALTDLVKIAGRMAKSIESTDHLERGNPRAEIEFSIVKLFAAMLAVTGVLGIPILELINQRWAAVESNSIFCATVDF